MPGCKRDASDLLLSCIHLILSQYNKLWVARKHYNCVGCKEHGQISVGDVVSVEADDASELFMRITELFEDIKVINTELFEDIMVITKTSHSLSAALEIPMPKPTGKQAVLWAVLLRAFGDRDGTYSQGQ